MSIQKVFASIGEIRLTVDPIAFTSPVVIAQIFGVLLTIVMVFLVSRQKPSRLRSILQWDCVSVAVCMLSYLFEMLSEVGGEGSQAAMEGHLAVVMENLSLFAIVSLTAAFMFEFCNTKVPKWVLIALYVDLAACGISVATSKYHNFQYQTYEMVPSGDGKYAVWVSELGVGYYWMAASVMIGILYSVVAILAAYRRTESTYKRRSYIFALLSCAPALAFFPVKLLIENNSYDLGPLLMTIMTFCFIMLTMRFRIFDLATVAKDNILQAIAESIVVLDAEGEVAYVNDVALGTFSELSKDTGKDFVANIIKSNDNGFTYNGKDYEWKTNKLYNGKRFEGITVCISDVTYLKNDNRELSTKVEDQTKKIREQSKKLSDTQQQVIISMAELIDGRGTGGDHVRRTTAIIALIARTLQQRGFYSNVLTDDYIDALSKVAPLYDVGKIAVPDTILQKPGRFTNDEFKRMQAHTTEGGRIIRSTLRRLEDSKLIDMAYDLATYHHEKYGGNGYPTGLSGDAIPLGARIVAIADVFDELISERSYKAALPLAKAFDMIEAGKGSHFDPIIVDVFLSLRGRIEELINE